MKGKQIMDDKFHIRICQLQRVLTLIAAFAMRCWTSGTPLTHPTLF